MEMTTAIQYILTAAQPLGSQDNHRMSRMGLLVYYSAKESRYRQSRLSYGPKKILTCLLREAKGGLKVTVGNKVRTRLSLYLYSCLFFSVSLNLCLVSPSRLCSKACQHILDILGLSQAEV